jgi:Flp pilus assembly pilin Flp
MLTYNNIYVRYGLLIAVIALALIKRRTIIDTALSLVGKKKEK